MSEEAPIQVAIAGAGPVGLTLAALLARRGVRTLVFDRKAELSERSRAVALFPRSLEVLHESGALDAVVANGQVNRAIRLRRADTHRLLLDFPFTSLDPISACGFMVAIPQDRTERAMLAALEGREGVEVRFGTELTGFEAAPDGVSLSFADGAAARADYLVGCDGAKSLVRDALGWKLEGKTYPTRAFLADVRVTAEADSVDGWRVDTELPGFVSCIRYAERCWRIIDQSVPEDEGQADLDARALDHARALFGENGVERVLWASSYRKHERLSDRFVDGRVILAGDAAHLNSPAGGQGMNSGIRDALNLAWKLDLALSGSGEAERLLASYEQEQRAAFRDEVGPFTDAVERMQTAPVWIRKLGFRNLWLGRALGLEERMARSLSMLFIDYGASTLLAEEGDLIGRRMPNVMLPSGRLFDLVGRRGLLVDRDGDREAAAMARRLGLPVARLPRELDELGFEGVEQILVRPDHVIALASADALDEGSARHALGLRPEASPPVSGRVDAVAAA